MNQEIYAYLKIVSDSISTEYICEKTKINFDEILKKGEKIPKLDIIRKSNSCKLSSKISNNNELSEHLLSLLEQLEPYSDSLLDLSNESDITIFIQCVLYFKRPPAVYFDKNIVEKISKIGAEIDIDMNLI